MFVVFPDSGKQRHNNDAEDHGREVLFDERNVAEEISGERQEEDPDERTGNIIEEEFPVAHFSGAGQKGREGPDDREEAGKNDRFRAVFFKKIVRAFQVFRFKDAAVFFLRDPVAHERADPVIDRIPEDGRNE